MPKGMSFFKYIGTMSESKIQVLIIFLGLIFVVFSFFFIFNEPKSEKTPSNHLECTSQAKVSTAKRSAQICSARYKEKLSCYLNGSIKKCEEIFPQTFISGCTLPDKIIAEERKYYMADMKVCNENFND
jgi:hypothetical protein